MKIERRIDFHGHSKGASLDAKDAVQDLVSSAIDRKLDYFGISDHHTTKNVRELISEIRRVNEMEGRNIIPIISTEVTTDRGHVLLAKPTDEHFTPDDKFLSFLQGVNDQSKPDLDRTIVQAVKEHGALVVIPHPGYGYIKSVPLQAIERLGKTLPANIKKNIGLEVKNWMTSISPFNFIRQSRVERLADKYDFAKVGGSDFHRKEHIGNQVTVFTHSDIPSGSLFVEAFQSRHVSPGRGRFMGPITRVGLIIENGWMKLQDMFRFTPVRKLEKSRSLAV